MQFGLDILHYENMQWAVQYFYLILQPLLKQNNLGNGQSNIFRWVLFVLWFLNTSHGEIADEDSWYFRCYYLGFSVMSKDT